MTGLAWFFLTCFVLTLGWNALLMRINSEQQTYVRRMQRRVIKAEARLIQQGENFLEAWATAGPYSEADSATDVDVDQWERELRGEQR